MAVNLDHTILRARDKFAAAKFLTDLLGLEPPSEWGPFAVVKVGEVSLDYVDYSGEIESRHFAFKVSESEFDEVFARVQEQGLNYWADPGKKKPNEINRRDGGRGFYFPDPNGHFLEVLTRSYGSES